LSPQLADAPSRRIDRVIGPDLAEDLESVSSMVRTVGGALQQHGPGILKGAATGFLAGGPAGALVGGIGGGLSSAGVLPGAGAAPAGAQPLAVAPVPGQPIANPAALQLLLTILRPEIVEALIAMALGRHGARGVEIAGQAVPVAAVSNLIHSLAEVASASHHAMRPQNGVPRYLAPARMRGEDISSPEVRATALLELIHDAWDEDIDEGVDEDFDEHFDEDVDESIDEIYPGVFE
jgi:hypothetical protein